MPQPLPRQFVPQPQPLPRQFVPQTQPLPRQFVPQNNSQDVLRPLRKEVPVSVVTRPGVSTGPPVSTLRSVCTPLEKSIFPFQISTLPL
jgi:hypothetical protein